MAVIFMDGFDWYTTADIGKRWTQTSAGCYVGPAVARLPSGQGFGNGGASAASWGGVSQYRSFGSNYTQGVLGFAVYGASSMSSKVFVLIGDGTSEQISIRTNSSSVPIVSRSGTTLATGTTVLVTGTWYYFELKYTINASTGVIELHLNGSTEISSTGSLNTRSTGNTQWNSIAIQNTNNGGADRYDDFYVIDSSTGSNTTFLGPVQVVARYPNAPGNYAQWSPNGGTNYGSVSEPFEDGDVSFNQSSTANQIDSFAMQDLPASSGSVFATQAHIIARTTGVNTIAPLWRISSTDYAGTAQTLSSTYQDITQIYDVSPATSSAWTASEVAGAEFGYKLIS